MRLKFWKKATLRPDLVAFERGLRESVNVENHDGDAVARDFRRLFLTDDAIGKRVLFMLLHWCGEYDMDPPAEPDALARWAAKREIAGLIKAALYADLQPIERIEND